MGARDLTSALLKRMEEGTSEIYKRYESLIEASDEAYRKKEKAIRADYAAAANEAAARARIDLNNTLERMADSGYIHSGETVQAQISANASKNNALTSLAVRKGKDLAALENERAKERAHYALEAAKEASAYETESLTQIRDQENRDREFYAAQAQRAEENRLAEERLKLEQAKAEQTDSEASEGLVPSRSVYDYFDSIVKQNTRYEKDKGYKVINRTKIGKALRGILQDETLSLSYRYEMYLYAKSMGYLNEKDED